MKKPRVLIVENSMDFTGGLNSILRTSQWLKDQFDFQFLLPTGSRSSQFMKEGGFIVHEMPMREIRKDLLALIVYLPVLVLNAIRFSKLARRERIDVLISNDFYNLIPPVYRILGGKIPYLCFVRFLPSRFPRALVRTWHRLHARHAAKILAVSERVKAELPPNDKVVVLYDGVETHSIAPYDTTSTTLLYLSNYITGKGQEYAVMSFAKIAHEYPGWRLRFAGGDMGLEKNKQFKKQLLELSKELGCDSQIEWNEFTRDTRREFEQAAIALNFSDSESFSLTVQEALFSARPVIATDSGGPSEIIDDGRSGIIVKRRDVDAMTAAMVRLIKNPDMREQMGKFGFRRMIERFSPAATFGKLEALLLAALKQ